MTGPHASSAPELPPPGADEPTSPRRSGHGAPKYTVGQQVWVYDVNARGWGPAVGTVAKVGRKLVHVDYGYGQTSFRIEDGTRNDSYKRQWIRTLEERVEEDERTALSTRLREAGIQIRHGVSLTLPALRALVRVLDENR
jgi:hypothetical protein